MREYVCFPYLVQRTFEGFNKLCREFTDKSYGIAQEERYILYYDLPDGSVEGCEEFILGKHV